jgi:hypothetical protein
MFPAVVSLIYAFDEVVTNGFVATVVTWAELPQFARQAF